MNYSTIYKLIEKRNLTQESFCAAIGITTQGLDYMRDHKSCKVTMLEKIANYFEVDICIFFDDEKYKQQENNTVMNESVVQYNSKAMDMLTEMNYNYQKEVKELREENKVLTCRCELLSSKLDNYERKEKLKNSA